MFRIEAAISCIIVLKILISSLGCTPDELVPIMDDPMTMDTMTMDTIVIDTMNLLTCFDVAIDTAFNLCEDINISNPCQMNFDSFIMLSDEAKEYFPQFCLELNDSISFVDEIGEQIYFEVIDKKRKFGFISTILSGVDFCDSTNTSANQYCGNREIYELVLQNAEIPFKFQIALTSVMDHDGLEGFQYGSQLSILRFNIPIPPSGAIGRQDFRKIVKQNDLSFSQYDFEQEFLEIELNGISFENVYSNSDPISVQDYFKFYYAKDKGLIGFEDFTGKLWTVE